MTKWCNIPVKVTILKGNSLKSVASSEDCSTVEVEPLMLIQPNDDDDDNDENDDDEEENEDDDDNDGDDDDNKDGTKDGCDDDRE